MLFGVNTENLEAAMVRPDRSETKVIENRISRKRLTQYEVRIEVLIPAVDVYGKVPIREKSQRNTRARGDSGQKMHSGLNNNNSRVLCTERSKESSSEMFVQRFSFHLPQG